MTVFKKLNLIPGMDIKYKNHKHLNNNNGYNHRDNLSLHTPFPMASSWYDCGLRSSLSRGHRYVNVLPVCTGEIPTTWFNFSIPGQP